MRKYLLAISMAVCLMLACGPAAAQTASFTDADDGGRERVLVVYYSFTGNTAKVAQEIAGQTDGDVYLIETAETYDMDSIREQLKVQREQGRWPALAEPLPDFSAYDMIFIGMPVWGGDVPPPVVSFLQQADFNGKPVACFYTSGSRPREFMDNFRNYLKTGEIVADMDFKDAHQDRAGLAEAVTNWLKEINILLNS